jgi:hypothetical protein
LGDLLAGAEDHQLAEWDAVAPELVAQLVQRRLHRRRLGDRMAGALRRDVL